MTKIKNKDWKSKFAGRLRKVKIFKANKKSKKKLGMNKEKMKDLSRR